MIYTIEKRHEFGSGTMTTHWEVRSYTCITPIGVYAGGKTLKSGTKPQCEKFCGSRELRRNRDDEDGYYGATNPRREAAGLLHHRKDGASLP